MNSTTFKNLAIGQTFYTDRNSESGLLADLGKPGRIAYTKRTVRTYTDSDGVVCRVGSLGVQVWI